MQSACGLEAVLLGWIPGIDSRLKRSCLPKKLSAFPWLLQRHRKPGLPIVLALLHVQGCRQSDPV